MKKSCIEAKVEEVKKYDSVENLFDWCFGLRMTVRFSRPVFCSAIPGWMKNFPYVFFFDGQLAAWEAA